jgi:hypothetical protein
MKITATILVCISTLGVCAQEMLGISQSRYAGIQGVYVNPAFSTLNAMKREVGCGGYEFSVTNNFFGVKNTLFTDLKGYSQGGSFGNNAYTYDNFDPSKPGTSQLLLNISTSGPSFITKLLGERAAIGFFTRHRSYFNANQVDNSFLKLIESGFKYQPLQGLKLLDNNFEFQMMRWSEIGGNFSLRILNTDRHRLVVGINAKLLIGGQSIYLRSNKFDYTVLDDSTIRVRSARLEYSHSGGFSTPQIAFNQSLSQNFSNLLETPGFGMCTDWGAYYELKTRKGGDAYRFRFGGSLTDAGSIRYKESIFSRDFYLTDSLDVNLNAFKTLNVSKIDTSMIHSFKSDLSNGYFNMRLPTAFQFSADLRIMRWLYINASTFLPLDVPDRTGGVRQIRRMVIAPHIETKFISIVLPYSTNNFDRGNLGISLRYKGMWIGTNDLLTLITSPQQQSLSFYFAAKIPLQLENMK